MNFLVLCFSDSPQEPPSWNRQIPFYCHYENSFFPRSRDRARIDYLAQKWNTTHQLGLEAYPDATHVIQVGKQYLKQDRSLSRLVDRYLDGTIFAGNVWLIDESQLTRLYRTYDIWAYPDLENLQWEFISPKGLVQLSSVGIPLVYPVEAWRKHPFHNPEDHEKDGIWYNQFCRETGLPVLCDLSIRFFRSWRDSDFPYFSRRSRFKNSFRQRLLSIPAGIKNRDINYVITKIKRTSPR